MEPCSLIEKLSLEIANNHHDIKAEPQLALGLDHNLSPEDFFIHCDRFFNRPFSKDIVAIERKTDVHKKDTLELSLTRTGIYDQLPEGMFFDPLQAGNNLFSAADMATEYKKNKQKEQANRRFFMPFEHEFFWQNIALEREESRLLKGLQSGALNDYLIDFWSIPASLPKKYVTPLIVMIAHAHRIAGNLSLTAECLQEILQENISVKKIPPLAKPASPDCTYTLGKQQLGIDMICGKYQYEDHPVLEITIGPLQNSRIEEYLEGGSKEELMKTFYRFFIPVQAEVITNIEVEKKQMLLQTAEEPVLGYSIVL